jgi:hypothetical protein
MLQALHTYALKVDRMLYIGFALEAGGGASGPHVSAWREPLCEHESRRWQATPSSAGPRVDAQNRGATYYSCGRLSERLDASSAVLINKILKL